MKNRVERMARHVLCRIWNGTRSFPPAILRMIEQEIRSSESVHDGGIRFIVEGALHDTPLFENQSPRERALNLFSKFHMEETPHRNAVLIYVLLADSAVEIIVDARLLEKTSAAEWSEICRNMEAEFRDGRFEQGAINGVRAVSHLIVHHFHCAHHSPSTPVDQVIAM